MVWPAKDRSVLPNRSREAELSAERLREALAYDVETGVFTWRRPASAKMRVGDVAGNASHKRGYRMIRVDYNRYLAHRLAWLYVYGEWPSLDLDHIDGDTANNRISNLRMATRQQNCWNGATKSNNKFGVRHIRPKGRRFIVQFLRGKQRIFKQSFPTLEAAITARNAVAASLHGEFRSHGR